MENNLILEGLLSMVTELKERQEKQVTPASREETINRLDVIEQRISEMQGKSGIPENMVREILNQIGSIRKGQSENQKQDLEDIKGLIVTSHRYFKERLKVLFPADDTPAGEITPVSWYGKLIYRVTPYLKPKFFLLSAGFIICIISLILNIRFTERMQRLHDNDIKYRYILMKGKADGSSLDLLETKFSRERDNAFIRSLTNSVKGFEYRSRKQAEALERARLLNEQAEQLKEEADKLGKSKAGAEPPRLSNSLLFLRAVFFLELAQRGNAEPLLDELPDIGSLIVHFSADCEIRQRTDSPVALQGLDTHLEEQAQVLIIQQVVIFGQHPVGIAQYPYILAEFFQFGVQLLHPYAEIVIVYIHDCFIFLIIHYGLSID